MKNIEGQGIFDTVQGYLGCGHVRVEIGEQPLGKIRFGTLGQFEKQFFYRFDFGGVGALPREGPFLVFFDQFLPDVLW